MAINALIAQGIRPIGADVPEVGNLLQQMQQRKVQNALAEQRAATDQQSAQAYSRQVGLQADQRQAELTRDQWAYVAQMGTAMANAKSPDEFSILAQRLASDPKYQSLPGALTADQFTPEMVRATLPEAYAKAGIQMPQAPDQIVAQDIEGFRVLTQGGKPVPGGVQQPDRPQAPQAPEKPQLVDVRLPDGTVQKQWVRPGQATGTPVGAAGKPGADENRTFARADKLRDEFNAASKELVTVADNFAKIQEVSADNSAAGDLSLIFSYMKMLDPNSVVREQEFANAQNAAGVPDRIRAAYNKVISGERLAPAQRADFIKQAGNVYNAQKKRHDSTVVKRYTAMAKRWQVDPQDVVGDLSVSLPQPAAPAAAPAKPGGAAPKRVKVDAQGNIIGN